MSNRYVEADRAFVGKMLKMKEQGECPHMHFGRITGGGYRCGDCKGIFRTLDDIGANTKHLEIQPNETVEQWIERMLEEG